MDLTLHLYYDIRLHIGAVLISTYITELEQRNKVSNNGPDRHDE